MWCPGNGTVSSNLTLSAEILKECNDY
jgi:hypothetical protein